jgi:hypothetical protein
MIKNRSRKKFSLDAFTHNGTQPELNNTKDLAWIEKMIFRESEDNSLNKISRGVSLNNVKKK